MEPATTAQDIAQQFLANPSGRQLKKLAQQIEQPMRSARVKFNGLAQRIKALHDMTESTTKEYAEDHDSKAANKKYVTCEKLAKKLKWEFAVAVQVLAKSQAFIEAGTQIINHYGKNGPNVRKQTYSNFYSTNPVQMQKDKDLMLIQAGFSARVLDETSDKTAAMANMTAKRLNR